MSSTTPDRRDELLEAGLEEFEASAYEDVSVDAIAARAGVAHGLLFHYFGNKKKFYVAVFRRHIEKNQARFATNDHADPAVWLRRELDIFVTGVSQSSDGFLGSVNVGFGEDPEIAAVVEAFKEQTAQRFIAAIGVRATPLLHLAVRGWIAFAMESARQWREQKSVSRKQMLYVLTTSFIATVELAADAEPHLGIQPERFRAGAPALRSAG